MCARAKSRSAGDRKPGDRKPWTSFIIDVTFGGDFGHIWLKSLKRRHFRASNDKGNERKKLYWERETRITRPCCKLSRCGTIFWYNKWKKEKRVLLASSAGLSFPGNTREQRPRKGYKKRPASTENTASTCLFVVSVGNAPMPKV